MPASEGKEEPVRITASPWDSMHFGFRCGSLDFGATPAEGESADLVATLDRALAEAAAQRYRFLTAKIPARRRDLTHVCQRHGLLVDTEVTFRKRRAPLPERRLPQGVEAQRFRTFWDESFTGLARTLCHSRFFADPHIDKTVAATLWTESIRNSCTGRASYSVVGFHEGRPAGVVNVFEKGAHSDIFLIAVLPRFQGLGIGRAMMERYQEGLDETIEDQTVETQVTNFAAQRLYTACGYNATDARHTFHFWLDPAGA